MIYLYIVCILYLCIFVYSSGYVNILLIKSFADFHVHCYYGREAIRFWIGWKTKIFKSASFLNCEDLTNQTFREYYFKKYLSVTYVSNLYL